MDSFGELLKRYRNRCRDSARERPLTQERLAELLSIESGVESYSGSTVSNWERGLNQIRRDDRHVLVGLIKTVAVANRFLLAGNYRPLDEAELRQINPDWKEVQTEASDAPVFPLAAEQEAMLPPPTYSQLFGVEEVIGQLLAQLHLTGSPHLLLIVGLSGLGKTAVADAVARHVIREGSFNQVIWLSTETLQPVNEAKTTAGSLTETIISALFHHLFPSTLPEPNPIRQLAQIRGYLKRHRYLIVIDNLEDPAETNQLLLQLNDLGGQSKFLLTARQYPTADTEVYILPLKELTTEVAIAFLRYQAEIGGVTDIIQVTDQELQQIVRVIGGHPLALRLTTRLARMTPLSILLANWQRDQPSHILQMYNTIYATLWQGLTPVQKQLLQIMPLTAQAGATADHLQRISGLATIDFWSALPGLVELCLVETRGSLHEQRYGIHSLTEHFLRSHWGQGKELTASIIANVAYWVQHISHLPEIQWHTLDVDRFNIFQAIQVSLTLPQAAVTPALQENWQRLSELLFRFVEMRGYGYEWLPLLKRLIEKFQDNSKEYGRLLNRLGEVYRLSFQFTEAVQTHQNALHIAREVHDELEIARAYFNLGNDYLRHNADQKAAEHGQLALDVFRRLNLTGRETAAALNLLGTAAQKQDELESSENYLRAAAAIWRKLGRIPELARTLNNLALTLQNQEKIDEAIACYAEAKRALSSTASELDRTLIYLSEGTLYFKQKRFSEAEGAFKQIDLTFLRQTKHLIYLASALNNLGNVAFVEGKHEEAEAYLQESAAIWRQLGDEGELANTLGRLGDVLVLQKKEDAARHVYEEVDNLLAIQPENKRTAELRQEVRQALKKLIEVS